MKLIQDDEQYERAREGLLKMAAELDDPLSGMSDEDRERKNLIYDRTAEAVREYRRSELVVVFPGLKRAYEQLGVPYRDFSSSPQEDTSPEQTQQTGEPEQVEPTQPAASRLSGWLDD